MKVYLSVDMEGIAGVNHPGPTGAGHGRYPAAVELMIGETNAAIEGALAGGATEILVNDSHGVDVQPAAGADPSGGARPPGPEAVVDGGRAPGPTPGSTWRCSSATTPAPAIRAGRSPTPTRSRPVETRLDGRPTGEYGLNALVARARGASRSASSPATTRWPRRSPPGCRGRSGSWSRRPHGGNAAASLHPTVAGELLRAGAERAVRRAAAGELELLRVGPPVVIEVDYGRGVEADHAAIVPGAERVGDRGVRFASDDPLLAYRGFLAGQPTGERRRPVSDRVVTASRRRAPYLARPPGARDRVAVT